MIWETIKRLLWIFVVLGLSVFLFSAGGVWDLMLKAGEWHQEANYSPLIFFSVVAVAGLYYLISRFITGDSNE